MPNSVWELGPVLRAATHIRNCFTGRLRVWPCSLSWTWGWEVHDKTDIFTAGNHTTFPLQNIQFKSLSAVHRTTGEVVISTVL